MDIFQLLVFVFRLVGLLFGVMWKTLSLTMALCLLVGCSAESETDAPRCKLPPVWKTGEEEPMKNALGRVTVVAYLQASWLFCLEQASKWVQNFYFHTNNFKHVKENHQNFHETLFFKPLSGRILDSVLFLFVYTI